MACTSSLGRIFTLHTRGIFVDIPLATTEGLRAVPRLYGEEIREYRPIRDWKSGAEVAGKNFAYGLTEGIADLFVQPIKGGRREGAVGVAKGLGKGLAGAATKIPAGKSAQPMKLPLVTDALFSWARLAGLHWARHMQEYAGLEQIRDEARDKAGSRRGRTASAEYSA